MAQGEGIVVIGAGVVGLTTALRLLQRGHRVQVRAESIETPPASWAAPAMFTPYPGPEEGRWRRWTESAFVELARVAREHPESGVVMGPLRELFHAPREIPEWSARLLSIRPIAPAPPLAQAHDSLRPVIDMVRYLPWLRDRVVAQGGVLQERRVDSLDAVLQEGFAAAVLCAGTGSGELARDPRVRPMHGQVAHVPNDIGLDHSVHDDGPGGHTTYVFRFSDRLVVGGTFQANRPAVGTDPASIEAILERGRAMLRLDGHPRWSDLGSVVLEARGAARPTRGAAGVYEDVRVGPDPEHGRRLIHHYGHGRQGATLSWATSTEVADLLGGSLHAA